MKFFTNHKAAFWGGFIFALPLGFVIAALIGLNFQTDLLQAVKNSRSEAIKTYSNIQQKLEKYENFYPVGDFEGYGYQFEMLNANHIEVTFARRQYENYEIKEQEIIRKDTVLLQDFINDDDFKKNLLEKLKPIKLANQ